MLAFYSTSGRAAYRRGTVHVLIAGRGSAVRWIAAGFLLIATLLFVFTFGLAAGIFYMLLLTMFFASAQLLFYPLRK